MRQPRVGPHKAIYVSAWAENELVVHMYLRVEPRPDLVPRVEAQIQPL